MVNEDLTIVIAGFRTSRLGMALYVLACILTGGLAYLLFRWLPRWYVAVLGRPHPLRECDWVVIENQWGELVIEPVKIRSYGQPVSTVFGLHEKMFSDGLDEDNDPLIDNLRMLDYRYVRFWFHPLKDKFALAHGWKDPDWTDVRSVRSGLDSDHTAIREVIFGSNLIDIEEKSVGQLLVDEVGNSLSKDIQSHCLETLRILTQPGASPLLHFPDRQPSSVVSRYLLLLRRLYLPHICG